MLKQISKYYILEEKAKGRNLYYGFVEELYPECVTKFDYKPYLDIVRNPNYYPYEFDEIVKTYLHDYIKMNEYLEAMPESQLADMIVSIKLEFILSLTCILVICLWMILV